MGIKCGLNDILFKFFKSLCHLALAVIARNRSSYLSKHLGNYYYFEY